MSSVDVRDEIKSRIDIVSLISRYVELKRGGSNFMGLCPFHKEKTPSFTVFPVTQTFFCFGCGKHGDIFTFIMEKENVDFKTALQILAKEAGVELPQYTGSDTKDNKIKENIFKINEITAKYFFKTLGTNQGREGYEYLKQRGFSDATIKQFGLGYAVENEKTEHAENIVKKFSDELLNILKSNNFTDEEIDEAKIFNQYKSGLLFRGRVICPIVNKLGKIVGFSGRLLPKYDDGSSGKYYNTTETLVFKKSRNLFGINYALKNCKDSVILVEGNFDVISMHAAGFNNTVAPMGTAFNDSSANEIKNLHTKKVYLSYDADSAGRKSALKVIPFLEELNIPTFVIDLAPAKDPDELLKTLGKDEMKKRIENAIPSFDFELGMMSSNFDLNHPDGRAGLYKSVVERLSKYKDRIIRKQYSEYAAKILNYDKTDMFNAVEKYIKDNNLYKEEPEARRSDIYEDNTKSASIVDEKTINTLMENQTIFLNALFDIKDIHKDIFDEACSYIKLGDIKTSSKFSSEIYNFLQSEIYKGLSQEEILNKIEQESIKFGDKETKDIVSIVGRIIFYNKYESIREYSDVDIKKYLSTLIRNIKNLQIEFLKQSISDSNPDKLKELTKLNQELNDLKKQKFFGIM